jgi:hypothetical protein
VQNVTGAEIIKCMQTQNICSLIRIADTPSIGVVVPPDRFVETALGSSLYPTEGYCLRVYSSATLSMLKTFIYFYLFVPRVFKGIPVIRYFGGTRYIFML